MPDDVLRNLCPPGASRRLEGINPEASEASQQVEIAPPDGLSNELQKQFIQTLQAVVDVEIVEYAREMQDRPSNAGESIRQAHRR